MSDEQISDATPSVVAVVADSGWRGESWVLIERWCERYPDDWRLYFERPDGMTLEISVPEATWRAFDGIKTQEVLP